MRVKLGQQFEIGGIEVDGATKNDNESALRSGIEKRLADLDRVGRQGPVELFDRLAILCVQKYRHQSEGIGDLRLARLRSTIRRIVNNEIGDDNVRTGKGHALLECPVEIARRILRDVRHSGWRSALVPKVRQVCFPKWFWSLGMQLKCDERQSQQNEMISCQWRFLHAKPAARIVSATSQKRVNLLVRLLVA